MNPGLQQRFSRVKKARADLLARVEGVDEARLNQKPGEGQWSVIQVFCHLIKVEELSLGYIRKKMQAGTDTPLGGFVSKLKSTALTMVMRTSLRVKAPDRRVANLPESQTLQETIENWNRVRADWQKTLDSFPVELLDRTVYRHPVVGLMNIEQGLAFLEEHIRHHVKQVDRTLKAVGTG